MPQKVLDTHIKGAVIILDKSRFDNAPGYAKRKNRCPTHLGWKGPNECHRHAQPCSNKPTVIATVWQDFISKHCPQDPSQKRRNEQCFFPHKGHHEKKARNPMDTLAYLFDLNPHYEKNPRKSPTTRVLMCKNAVSKESKHKKMMKGYL
jgi:hypothetical protein